MTYDAVREAVASLRAAGVYPSHRALLARLGGGSKRAIAGHLRAAPGSLEPKPAAPSCPEG
jgi:hypothetical protein